MKTWTVKQLAQLSGVSVRALHYYDEIGLLKPARVAATTGYRHYGEAELLRLQQILLHRELGLPLESIAALLQQDTHDRAGQLRGHRQRLVLQIARYRALVATLDRTINALEGGKTMDTQRLYEGFAPEKQAEYEQWLIERDGEPMRAQIEASRRQLEKIGAAGMQQRMQQLAEIEVELAGHCRRGTSHDDPALHAVLANHHTWVGSMWHRPCPPEAYAGLADLYEAHPDFRARFETLAPGLSDYLPAAMRAYSRMVST